MMPSDIPTPEDLMIVAGEFIEAGDIIAFISHTKAVGKWRPGGNPAIGVATRDIKRGDVFPLASDSYVVSKGIAQANRVQFERWQKATMKSDESTSASAD